MALRQFSVTFEVALTPERVWEVVGDTQRMNELLLGLKATTLVARDGEKARLRGTFGIFAPEYDEFPWVFEVPRRYRSRRVFTRGVLKTLEVDCSLTPTATGVSVTNNVVVDGVDGVVGSIATWVFARRFTGSMRRVEALLRRVEQRPGEHVQWPPANPLREAVLARARPLVESLSASLVDDEQRLLELLLLHVADATDADVARMRPYVLADQWQARRRAALTVFLRAARAGLLRLSWDVLCPSCEAPTSFESLKDLPAGGHCPACDIDFRTDFDRNVEATFRPEPAVRAASRLLFCHGSPSSTPSWLAQFVVPAKSSHTLALQLGVGRYRLQAQGLQQPVLIDVDDNAAGNDASATLSTSAGALALRVEGAGGGVAQLKPGACTIVVDNLDDQPHRVQLAWRAFASGAATAADVTGVGLFRELFGSEVLSPSQHVAVGQRTILFTDLVGSTALYERIGDAAAYGLVRRHFDLLKSAIEAHDGQVVKTVGDAVMAAFDVPLDGARAGLACIEALRTLRDVDGGAPGLKLRVGVHSGPCIAIDANEHVDYFGRTVNVAARVESLGGADELVVSWSVRAAAGVAGFVEAARVAGHDVVDDRQRVKGVAADVEVTRIRLRERGA